MRNKKGQFVLGYNGYPPKKKWFCLKCKKSLFRRRKTGLCKECLLKQKRTDEFKKKVSLKLGGKIPKNLSSLHGKGHWNWRGGITKNSYSVDWTETLKRSIRERDNYICQICNRYGNQVHHIDYDKNNCEVSNLITLCVGCHGRTNKNRIYWIKLFKNG